MRSCSLYLNSFIWQGSESKSNLEGFSQLLRVLCWCLAYISTPDAMAYISTTPHAMEASVFILTLVSASPMHGYGLGPVIFTQLVKTTRT
jgi:phosphatidylinositol 4-kinase